jgi:hypothetical protein
VLGACTPEDVGPQDNVPPPPTPSAAALAEPLPPPAIQPTQRNDEILAPAGQLTVTSPVAEARVSSPLVVEGSVLNDWMFEGVFPVKLEVDGVAIAEGPAQQQAPDNWTNPGPVKFRAELAFTVDVETAATLVLAEDMPAPVESGSDVAGPARTLRIPVTLVPTAQ